MYSSALPLNASRLVGINDNKKNDNQPIQHRPQPKITAQRRPDSHINPVDIKESIVPIPETFLCWLCGQTLPEKEREDHMLCHKMQEEVDNYKNDIEKNNQQRPSERPNHNQPRSNQNQQSNKGLLKDLLKINKGYFKDLIKINKGYFKDLIKISKGLIKDPIKISKGLIKDLTHKELIREIK